jgi:hypothetical protein
MAEGKMNVSTLPPIDSVEVLVISGDYEPSRRGASIPGNTVAKLTGELAQQVAQLWRSLPDGEQMRCHNPRHGLRFYCGESVLLEAAICFECNNISIIANGRHEWVAFDGQAPSSQRLLAMIR